MKKIIKRLSFLLLAVFVLAACSIEGEDKAKTEEKSTETSVETKEGGYKIGVSLSTLNNPFFVSIREGIEEKAKEEGAEVVISDAQNDSSVQSNQIEDLITQKVDLIIINPVDSTAISSSVQKANEANIPVICVDRGTEDGEIVSLVASNNVEGGKMAGEFILEKVGENAEVIQLEGIPGASSTRERGQGFEEATKDKINLVASQTANFDRAEGLTVMENLLQAQPDVKAVFCQNDEMALGASEAIKASGKDIVIVGFDGNDDAVEAVKNGDLAATVAQQPKEMGKLAMENAINHLKGETIEEHIDSPLELVK
ncbi:D-ribose ABC transporter substrate-binding protein [Anaerococcus degeneri]|uniref:D-ribose ABC transporter substrate-binding protein n=1 Tax=Anaerococcus degeneri TaxID=361500 RepID=A0ABS7Z0M3_9FIRM|nr:D-ribose ABC transporter substrate-binding protein [Anaerococcus degeneri]MBP2015326.1 ribose transport system substrate-binding protein [Anaerococcus degeneri]MCA2096222.1 D-ribose ABC transporter substrate-binding protein [Anaerococcus degeneri]